MRLARAMIPAVLLALTAASSCTALHAFAAEPAAPAPMSEAEFDRTFQTLQSDTVVQCLDRTRLQRLGDPAMAAKVNAQLEGARTIWAKCREDGFEA